MTTPLPTSTAICRAARAALHLQVLLSTISHTAQRTPEPVFDSRLTCGSHGVTVPSRLSKTQSSKKLSRCYIQNVRYRRARRSPGTSKKYSTSPKAASVRSLRYVSIVYLTSRVSHIISRPTMGDSISASTGGPPQTLYRFWGSRFTTSKTGRCSLSF